MKNICIFSDLPSLLIMNTQVKIILSKERDLSGDYIYGLLQFYHC